MTINFAALIAKNTNTAPISLNGVQEEEPSEKTGDERDNKDVAAQTDVFEAATTPEDSDTDLVATLTGLTKKIQLKLGVLIQKL